MSEQPKKKGLSSAKIVLYITCAVAFIVLISLCVRFAVKSDRELESRRQSAVEESLSLAAVSNEERDQAEKEAERLQKQVTNICKNHNVKELEITLDKKIHEPYSSETESDPIRYEFEIMLQIGSPEEIKDWVKFYYFLDELKNLKPAYPFIELHILTYYMGTFDGGTGEKFQRFYGSNIDSHGLVYVGGGDYTYYGMKTDKGIAPLSEFLPYEGMPAEAIDRTKLGKHSDFNYVKQNPRSDKQQDEGITYYYWYDSYHDSRIDPLCKAAVQKGKVISVEYNTKSGTPSKIGSSSGGSYRPSGNRPVTTTKKAYYDDDPYNARDFNDPEDFYDYYYDDFEDYEEAYDYFYEHNPD